MNKKGTIWILIGIYSFVSHAMEKDMEYTGQVNRALAYRQIRNRIEEEIRDLELSTSNAILQGLNGKTPIEKMVFLAGVFFERSDISINIKQDVFEIVQDPEFSQDNMQDHAKTFDELVNFWGKYLFHEKSSIASGNADITIDSLVRRYRRVKRSFLATAIYNNEAHVAEILCGLNADPLQRDGDYNIPLYYGLNSYRLKKLTPLLIYFSIERPPAIGQDTLLNSIIKDRKISLLSHIIKNISADYINTPGMQNKTAVHHAASRGNIDVMKQLIERGGDITKKDCFGETPLFKAVKKNQYDMVEYLILLSKEQKREKEYVNTINAADLTPLQYAHILKTNNIKRVLCLAGAKFDLSMLQDLPTQKKKITGSFRKKHVKKSRTVSDLTDLKLIKIKGKKKYFQGLD